MRNNPELLMLAPRKSEAVDISATDHTFALDVQGIFVGVEGDVVARLKDDDSARTWKGCPAGTILLGRFASVTKVGTTATDLIGLQSRPER